MIWQPDDRQLPGSHQTQAHSQYAALENPARATFIACRLAEPATQRLPQSVPLAGLWERCVDLTQARTRSTDFSLPRPDARWEPANVPQNYGLEPELQFYWGPVWYRRTLLRPAGATWVDLNFGAVDYLCDVVLNGAHLGRHEGYFAPFAFDLSARLREAEAAELIVRVQDPLEDLRDDGLFFIDHRKRWIKGTMNYHDSRPGGMMDAASKWTFEEGQSKPTGGITGPVSLDATGPVRLDGVFVTPLDLEGRVHLALVALNRAADKLRATVVLELVAPDNKRETDAVELEFAPGYNRIDLEAGILDPQLWYDAALFERGGPDLYTLRAVALVDGVTSSARRTRFGLRTAKIISHPRWHYELNGEAVYLRAANTIPTQHWANVGRDFYERDFSLLRKAHLHSVGLHAHVQSPACYDAADRMGISIFQDFPLQWAYASGTREDPAFIPKAAAMAAEMAYLLWNHPSVVYYAAHNEPFHVIRQQLLERQAARDASSRDSGAEADDAFNQLLRNEQLVTDPAIDLGNTYLDKAIQNTLEQVDPTRHVMAASGSGEDAHEYPGGITGGVVYDVGAVKAPFVSEYGSWTVGRTVVKRCDHWAKPWPPDGDRVWTFCREGLIWKEPLEMAGNFNRYPNVAAFAYATERKGAFIAKYQTEFYRCFRNQPYTGYRWHFFVNYWGHAGAGLLDVDRMPTYAYGALAGASRDRLVASFLRNTIFPPGALAFPIFAINDRRAAWPAVVRWRVERLAACEVIRAERHPAAAGIDGHLEGSYVLPLPGTLAVLAEGELRADVPANETARAGDVAFRFDQPGPHQLVMAWDGEENGAVEENDFTVLIAPHSWQPQYGLSVIRTRRK